MNTPQHCNYPSVTAPLYHNHHLTDPRCSVITPINAPTMSYISLIITRCYFFITMKPTWIVWGQQPHNIPIYYYNSTINSSATYTRTYDTINRVPPGHGKSWNLGRPFSRPGKSWKIAKVMEKSWKMMIMSWNFYYCTEQFCKSDTTSFIKSNYEPFLSFWQWYYEQMELSLLILVCIHKSYIVTWKYVLCR